MPDRDDHDPAADLVATLDHFERRVIDDQDGDSSYLYQDGLGFEERRAAYENGEFGFVGVQAVAHVLVHEPGSKSGTMHEIGSAGLWSIESDSGDEYLRSVYLEEIGELLPELRALNVQGLPEASA